MNHIIRSKKHFIFDFDLTLVDSLNAAYLSTNYALGVLGFKKFRKNEVKKIIGFSLIEGFEILTKNCDKELALKFEKLFIFKSKQIAIREIKFYKNVDLLFKILKSKSFSISIVSTKEKETVENILLRENFLKFIDQIVGKNEVSKPKPDPEGLIKAMGFLNAKKYETIYIGDSIIDGNAALNANVDFIGLETGNFNSNLFKDLGFVNSLESIDQLNDLLLNVFELNDSFIS